MPTLSLRVTLPKPHAAQQSILREAARWNIVACGRRFGKTVLGENVLIQPALEGKPVAWFSPTYKMLSEIWRDLKNVTAPVTKAVSVQDHRIELITGGVIEMWSLENPDSARGRKYARIVIDEAAMVKNLGDAWNAVLRPSLADFRGDCWMLSTPRGQNFFAQAFAYGQDEARPDWMSWRMPTHANPFIAPAEIEEIRSRLPERVYLQEILAEFLEEAGGVFRNVTACIDRGRTVNELPSPGRQYSMGVDLARVEDFTVIDVEDDIGRQVYHERFNQISWERQLSSIVRVAQAYRAMVYVDSTGVGDPMFEALRKANVAVHGYTLTNASKEQLIDNLAMAIEGGRVRLMDIPQQTAELLAYQYELTPSRNVRMNAPEGMHDDCVIARGLARWGSSLPRPGAPAVGGPRPVGSTYATPVARTGTVGVRR